jgi:hypothetical protein
MKAAKTNTPISTAMANAIRPKKNLFMLGDAGTTISFRSAAMGREANAPAKIKLESLMRGLGIFLPGALGLAFGVKGGFAALRTLA